jgi:hypothetical protein
LSTPVTSCVSADGCCPAGCTLENDDDCFTYYVDATGGDDSSDGLSPATACKSMGKVGAASLAPGESVGFKRGELWRETFVISSSGEAGHPVRFGAYGSGDKPVIHPTVEVAGWQLDSGQVWVADLATAPRQLFFDGELVPIAHDPNSRYHVIDVTSGIGTSLVDNELAPAGDVVRSAGWARRASPSRRSLTRRPIGTTIRVASGAAGRADLPSYGPAEESWDLASGSPYGDTLRKKRTPQQRNNQEILRGTLLTCAPRLWVPCARCRRFVRLRASCLRIRSTSLALRSIGSTGRLL